MNRYSKLIVIPGVCAASLLLTGCSSSDDDNGEPITLVGISAENANIVAGAVMSTIRLVDEIDLPSRIGFLQSPLASSAASAQNQEAIIPRIMSCSVNGSLTIFLNVADNTVGMESESTSLENGDTLSVVYDDCEQVVGATLSGTLNWTVLEFSEANPDGVFTYTMAAETNDLSLAAHGDVWALDISANVERASSAVASVDTSETVTIESLSYTEQMSDNSGTLTGFTGTKVSAFGESSYTQTSVGVLADTEIGGSVEFTSVEPFSGTQDGEIANNPSAGVMIVTGAQGSTEKITVLNQINLQLEVDAEGDGTFEESIQTTWDELFAI